MDGQAGLLARVVLLLACPCGAALAGDASAPGDFIRLGKPGPNDWRSVYREPVQTFADYKDTMPRALPFEKRRIVLFSLGTSGERKEGNLAGLAEFLGAYFMTRVEVGADREVPDDVPRRSSRGFGRQLLADEVLRHVAEKPRREDIAVVAITADDLYARAREGASISWVFGMGDARKRAAVCSLARFDWRYPGQPADAAPRRRLYKLVAHEVGHALGLAHCQTYACAMNGCNSLKESDAAPIHLCPECLKKLSWRLGFDRSQRYDALRRVYSKIGWDTDAAVVASRARRESGRALLSHGSAEKETPPD